MKRSNTNHGAGTFAIVTVGHGRQRLNHKDSKTQREPITDDACEVVNRITNGAILVYGQEVALLRKAFTNRAPFEFFVSR